MHSHMHLHKPYAYHKLTHKHDHYVEREREREISDFFLIFSNVFFSISPPPATFIQMTT